MLLLRSEQEIEIKLHYLIVIGLVLALMVGCVAPTPIKPTPIPDEILASHFGFCSVGQDMDEISKLGIRWNRSTALFAWGTVEPQKGEYVWRKVDGCVQRRQDYNFAILPIIQPFAEWDQANWGPAPADTGPMLNEEFLGIKGGTEIHARNIIPGYLYHLIKASSSPSCLGSSNNYHPFCHNCPL